MNKLNLFMAVVITSALFASCGSDEKEVEQVEAPAENFEYMAGRFADIQILRFKITGFEELTLQQKKLAYYLYEAGLNGRDIFFDQKNKYNLYVRHVLENIIQTFNGDKSTDEYKQFLTYSKQFFFANGMHHHYSNVKIIPEFSNRYFITSIELPKNN